MPDDFSDEQLIEALETLWGNQGLRAQLGEAAKRIIAGSHNPRKCAAQYEVAIEEFYHSALLGEQALVTAIAGLPSAPEPTDLIKQAKAIAQNCPAKMRLRQLFVDVSELVQRDSKSGIQRVVRGILGEWLLAPPEGWRVEPVYATENDGYRYARRFTLDFLGCLPELLEDELIECAPGDFFLGLDLAPHVVSSQQASYREMQRQGVCVKFVVYDLLLIVFPDVFSRAAAEMFTKWAAVVAEGDGVACISRAVQSEFNEWLKGSTNMKRDRPFEVGWFHLGQPDLISAIVSGDVPVAAIPGLRSDQPVFLMVSTVEPRKGHRQTFGAFEKLWAEGYEAQLVIVGKKGWMMDDWDERVKNHPLRDKKWFWPDWVSDETLCSLYQSSTALIAASESEGFGLPLIESAQKGLPIIARDIPVFREVAGDYAYYFNGKQPEDLAAAIKDWLALNAQGKAPKSQGMPYLTWAQSARQLAAAIGLGPSFE